MHLWMTLRCNKSQKGFHFSKLWTSFQVVQHHWLYLHSSKSLIHASTHSTSKLGSLESLTISYMPRKPIYRNLFLPSLTKLSLLECYSCVNDRTLDEIIARLPSLKILEVHDCALFRPNISSPTLQELHIASAGNYLTTTINELIDTHHSGRHFYCCEL
jgi:hypothetical protein